MRNCYNPCSICFDTIDKRIRKSREDDTAELFLNSLAYLGVWLYKACNPAFVESSGLDKFLRCGQVKFDLHLLI